MLSNRLRLRASSGMRLLQHLAKAHTSSQVFSQYPFKIPHLRLFVTIQLAVSFKNLAQSLHAITRRGWHELRNAWIDLDPHKILHELLKKVVAPVIELQQRTHQP